MIGIALPQCLERIVFLGKEMLFPRFCVVCRAEGAFLCEACFLVLSNERRHAQSCGHCGVRETPEGRLCFECAGTAPHDGIFAALRYGDPRIARLIHLFKYRFVRELGQPLGALFAISLLHSDLPLPDAIIPVPLHPRRERWRGWNQSEIVADEVARHVPTDIRPPVLKNLLIRTRFTAPQMSIQDKSLRKKNIEGAFRIISKDSKNKEESHNIFDVREKRIWIIDDVAASGSTIAACATILKEHGTREVFGIVVAR
jgi:ComF family protein